MLFLVILALSLNDQVKLSRHHQDIPSCIFVTVTLLLNDQTQLMCEIWNHQDILATNTTS
jgi:hypothetical protein